TQDIDARLRGFAQSIADTVNQTERRLIAARKAMEEALESTSSAVGERLTGFSAIASTESARAEAAVREAQQRLLADIERAYAEATERFNATAEAMRSTAGQLGKELEATRTELQRS